MNILNAFSFGFSLYKTIRKRRTNYCVNAIYV